MKKHNFLIFIALLCLVSSTIAQHTPYQYGTISLEELRMKSYEKDTTANALIYYEYGNAVIKRNGSGDVKLFYTYKARVKIFKKEAFHKATYKIPLVKSVTSNKKEKLIYAKAVAVNLDVPAVRLNKKDIYIEKYNEHLDYAKFTIPNVTEGTVFDVEYEIASDFIYNFQEWKFQDDIPKIHSEYHTSIPANYKYHIKLVGTLALESHTAAIKKNCLQSIRGGKADCEVNHYVMKNIPAFIPEEYMTAQKNYLSKIAFELKEVEDFEGIKHKYTKSWKDVDKEIKYKEDIGKQARKANSFKKRIPEDILSMPQDIDKARAIYNYLRKRMVWNQKYYIFSNVDVKKAFEERSGSAAELNLILLNMLNATGFTANFMLISTRHNGIVTRLYPIISEFNYLVVKLDMGESSYLLDITDKNIPFGALPLRALNGYGRVMDFENESYWYDVKATKLSLNKYYLEHRIDAEGKLTTYISNTHSGYFAVNKREELAKNTQEAYLKKLNDKLNAHTEASISKYEVYNKENLKRSVRETFIINFEEHTKENLHYLYPFSYYAYLENPFKLKNRSYPVDFGYPSGYQYHITIKADPSYEILELPEAQTLRVGADHAVLNFKSDTKTAQEVSLTLTLNINTSIFMPDEYEDLKQLFKALINIQNKLAIVLRKKQTH